MENLIAPGDKITCLAVSWINLNKVPNFRGPSLWEVVTVREVKVVGSKSDPKVMISLMGYNDRLFFPVKEFRILDREFSEAICKQITDQYW